MKPRDSKQEGKQAFAPLFLSTVIEITILLAFRVSFISSHALMDIK
jgi:hypothetical protein